jgi:MFS family permease
MRFLSLDADSGMHNRAPIAIAVAAGAVFALALGLRLSQPLFISALNSHTGAGYASISLAFAIAQLMWGIAQPAAGAVADRWGPRPVMIAAVLLAGSAARFAGKRDADVAHRCGCRGRWRVGPRDADPVGSLIPEAEG